MSTRIRTVFALLFAAALSGCGGNLGDLRGPPVRGQDPIQPPGATPTTGLTALCAGDNAVRVDFVLPGSGFEGALFLGTDAATLFAGAPVEGPLTGTSTNRIYTSTSHPSLVANGTVLFAGFGIRPTGTTTWTKAGTTIRCRPSAPIYVDASAAPGGDGTSPAQAYDKLDNALLVAAVFSSIFGGSNVWVLDGQYRTRPFNAGTQEGGAFSVGPGVHVYGGFAAGFAIADRDPDAGRTILLGGGPTRVLDVINGGAMHVVDGFLVDGENVTIEGTDVTESDCELRSVFMRRCTDNGLRIRQVTDFTNRRRIDLVACDVSNNGNDGVGVSGVFDLTLDRSTFDANGGRGIDPNDLLALSGGGASIRAIGCRFFGNSLDGFGADLNTILTSPQTPGGRFDIELVGCTFQRNGRDGCFVDQDYDGFPEWYTSVRIRDCKAIANRRAGIHFDADDQGDFVLDRVRCSANAGDGLWVSSEPDDLLSTLDDLRPGHVVVTNSAFVGNLGHGLQSTEGDKVVLATHCAFASNLLGGFTAQVVGPRGNNARRIGTAVNCVLWRQAVPFTNVTEENCFVETNDNPFVNAPFSVAQAISNSNGAITLLSSSGIQDGDAVEIGDNGTKLTVTSSTGGAFVVTPAPSVFVAPDAVFQYLNAATASVAEDMRVYSGSLALDTGLVAAGDAPVDPGPHGSLGGGEPGVFDPFETLGMLLLHTEPAIAKGVTATDPLVLVFDQDVDPTTVTSTRVVVEGVVGYGLSVSGNSITVSPPVGGWAANATIQVHVGLRSTSGDPLKAPLLVPVQLR